MGLKKCQFLEHKASEQAHVNAMVTFPVQKANSREPEWTRLEDTEVSAIPPFQGDHLDSVQAVVKDFTGKELVSHLLIVSQELGKRSNPSSTVQTRSFNCGKKGHFHRDCRLLPGTAPSRLRSYQPFLGNGVRGQSQIPQNQGKLLPVIPLSSPGQESFDKYTH